MKFENTKKEKTTFEKSRNMDGIKMFKKNLEKKETAKWIMKSKTIKKICKKGVAFGLAGILGGLLLEEMLWQNLRLLEI